MPNQSDLRKQITAKIVDAIESKHLLPWRRPWSSSKSGGRHCNVNRRAYSGINPLMCELHSMAHGLNSNVWGTFAQWKALGLNVMKRPPYIQPGEWGLNLVFYKPVKTTNIDSETGEQVDDQFLLMRSFTVFNADQVEGEGVEQFRPVPQVVTEFSTDYGPAKELLQATGAKIDHWGEEAFYRRPLPEDTWPNHTSGDDIVLPPKSSFASTGKYYETAFHELAHYSEVRLGWDHHQHGYAMGELVAEISASLLSAEVGVPQGESLENHAAYLKTWLDGMKCDSSFIFRASTQASKVTDYLLSFVRAEEPAESMAV